MPVDNAGGGFTYDTLLVLAQQAGFSADEASTAAAIAMAESGGNPKAHNSTPPDNSYGLWQINMLGDMGPSRRKWFGLKSNEELFDPVTNAKAAYKIYKASGWKAWTTYTSGKYKAYVGKPWKDYKPEEKQSLWEKTLAVIKKGGGVDLGKSLLNVVTGGASGAATNAAENVQEQVQSVTDIPSAISAAVASLSKNFAAAGALLAVFLLVGLGVVILLRKPIAEVATTVATRGMKVPA